MEWRRLFAHPRSLHRKLSRIRNKVTRKIGSSNRQCEPECGKSAEQQTAGFPPHPTAAKKTTSASTMALPVLSVSNRLKCGCDGCLLMSRCRSVETYPINRRKPRHGDSCHGDSRHGGLLASRTVPSEKLFRRAMSNTSCSSSSSSSSTTTTHSSVQMCLGNVPASISLTQNATAASDADTVGLYCLNRSEIPCKPMEHWRQGGLTKPPTSVNRGNTLQHINCRRLMSCNTYPSPIGYRENTPKRADYVFTLDGKLITRHTDRGRLFSGKHKRNGMATNQLHSATDREDTTTRCGRHASTEVSLRSGVSKAQGSADWIAEVVVISTSLRAFFKAYFDSIRCQHLLDCKGVEYFSVDISLNAGEDYSDSSIINEWNKIDLLFRDRLKLTENDVLVPQVLIDGVPVGGSADLLNLEDEADLDHILARTICPNCLKPRDAQSRKENFCAACGVCYRKLVDPTFMTQKQLVALVRRNLGNKRRVAAPLTFPVKGQVA